MLFMFASSCSDENTTVTIKVPVLTTTAVSSITSSTASCGGNITSDGGSTVTVRGVCWGESPTVTVTDKNTTDGTGTGSYTSSITGLTGNTTYYVRAYATNSKGTGYGSAKTFTTLPASNQVPVLTTNVAKSVTSTTAASGGNVSSDGGATITDRGICWGTTHNPTIANSKTTDGNGTGSFTSNLTGLTPNTTYYMRAYATNSVGTGYGNEISFLTMGIITDTRDGKTYQTVIIGTQVWMVENLQWQPSANTLDWKIYGDNPANGLVYGVLYHYSLSTQAAQGFTGWRVPMDADWKTLVAYLGGYQYAGGKLKEATDASPSHWTSPNTGATNTTGFTGLGSGYYDFATSLGFMDLKNKAYYWTSTPYSTYIVIYTLQTDDSWTKSTYGDKLNFYSIRLMQDL